jgi:putative transposase
MHLKQGKHHYSRVYLPGLGSMRYFDSRPFPKDADSRTVTVIREADGWYISVLLSTPEQLPEPISLEDATGINTIDLGINKLIASSDGAFVENPRFGTHNRTKRRLRIRQRRVSRKGKGSKNRAKAGKRVARVHKQITDKREAYQWQAASIEVRKADVIGHEDLNIQGMKKRCKPVKSQGRFMPNGQSAKRGLNRAIADAAWGGLLQKIAWLALKAGKPRIPYPAHHTSQECSKCHHVSPANREGEKFICESCGHIDHADTQAARNGQSRIGLVFVSKRRKKPTHSSSVPTSGLGESHAQCSDSASSGNRNQAGNPISKQLNLFAETGILEDIA